MIDSLESRANAGSCSQSIVKRESRREAKVPPDLRDDLEVKPAFVATQARFVNCDALRLCRWQALKEDTAPDNPTHGLVVHRVRHATQLVATIGLKNRKANPLEAIVSAYVNGDQSK
jgi:hypothetical protein